MRNSHRYHPDWKDIIRPAVLKRDNYKCCICSAQHKKSYVWEKDGSKFEIPYDEIGFWQQGGDKAYRVFLQVAHLDRDTTNNEMSNLKSFCPKCHLNYDRETNQILRKSKLKKP